MISRALADVDLATASARQSIMLELLNHLTTAGAVSPDHLGPAWEVLQATSAHADAADVARRLWDANSIEDRAELTRVWRKTVVTNNIDLFDREEAEAALSGRSEGDVLERMVGNIRHETGIEIPDLVIDMLDSTLSAVVIARESAPPTGRDFADPLKSMRRRAARNTRIILDILRDEWAVPGPAALATLRVTLGSDTLDSGVEGASSALVSTLLHLPVTDRVAMAWGMGIDTAAHDGDAEKQRQKRVRRVIARHRKAHGPGGEQLELPVDRADGDSEIGYDGPERPPENRSA